MKLFNPKLSRDPQRIREVLKQLCESLIASAGQDLESLILYGSLARCDQLQSEFDKVNVLIVLGSVDCSSLDRCVDPIRQAEGEIPLATMTLTKGDLRSSCDVFPIKFHDMQLNHRLLTGVDVLSDLEISDHHLRLRCEQQLKNLMLRLRAAYLNRSHNTHQLRSTLVEANRGFLLDLRACLYVKSGVIPESDADLADCFSAEFELDSAIVNEILDLSPRGHGVSPSEMRRMFDRFMRLVHDTALAVDQLEACS